MCELFPRAKTTLATTAVLIFAQVALACVGTSAGAAQELARLGARVVSTDRALNAAQDSVNAVIEELKNAGIPSDSLKGGAITLRFTAHDMPAATRRVLERAVAAAWIKVQSGLGDAAPRISRRLPVLARRGEVRTPVVTRDVRFELPGRPGSFTRLAEPLSEPDAEAVILEMIGTVASFEEPPTLKVYAGEWMPAARLTPEYWRQAAVDLATETSAATRDCYAGSVMRCESALGLTVIDDPLTEWYSPEDLRVIVAREPHATLGTPERKARVEKCLSGKAPEICELFAREEPVPPPLITDTRRSLIGLALELGGPQAFDRMRTAHGTALEILATTSGRDGASLVQEWRRRVLASAPTRVAPGIADATTMLAWTLVFAAAASRKRP